jgi:bifunctional non-homologous end joining protein LigD
MLATLSAPHSRKEWAYELKYDGYRILASKRGDQIQLVSRNGKDASAWFPEIVEGLNHIPGSFLLDGEACVIDASGRPDFQRMRAIARGGRRRNETVAYFAFDLVALGKQDCRAWNYERRKRRLFDLVPERTGRINSVDYVEGEGLELFGESVRAGLEGIVAKRMDSAYIGGRSLNWQKFKAPNYADGWKRVARASSSKALV